jgi:hypothetical protein
MEQEELDKYVRSLKSALTYDKYIHVREINFISHICPIKKGSGSKTFIQRTNKPPIYIDNNWEITWKFLEKYFLLDLVHLLYDYDYDINNFVWNIKTDVKPNNDNISSFSFYNEIPIEINNVFNSKKDMINIYKYKNDLQNNNVLELQKEKNTSKELASFLQRNKYRLFDINNFLEFNGLDTMFLRNLLDYNIFEVSFDYLFSEQDYVKNNKIYMKNGGYFKFYKLTPIKFYRNNTLC